MPQAAAVYVAVAGLAVAAYSANKQAKATKKAAKERKKSIAAQQRIADLKASRERVRAVREARVKRGMLAARAAGGGVSGASGAQAGQQGVISQLSGNLAFSQKVQDFGQQASLYNQNAADAQESSAKWGAIGGFGQSMFSAAGGFSTIAGGMGSTGGSGTGTSMNWGSIGA